MPEAEGAIPPRPAVGAGRGTAWKVAIAADVFQLALIPFFAGALSPLDDLLDVVVAIVLTRLLGWHFAFLPTFIAELVPGLDLFPTWTAAVWFVTRSRNPKPGPDAR